MGTPEAVSEGTPTPVVDTPEPVPAPVVDTFQTVVSVDELDSTAPDPVMDTPEAAPEATPTSVVDAPEPAPVVDTPQAGLSPDVDTLTKCLKNLPQEKLEKLLSSFVNVQPKKRGQGLWE